MACEYLSERARASITRVAGGEPDGGSCPAALSRLLSDDAFALARQAAKGHVTAVRVESGQAFVVYRTPGAKLFVLPMAEAGGRWKSTSLTGAVLVPDLG